MNLRIAFGVALIAILFGFWLLSTKPTCLAGFSASLDVHSGWTCMPR
jgi:hypothetical protein